MSNQLIAINGLNIKIDSEGRFCLNDLHKAAGGERRHDTREFMSRHSTLELVHELETQMTEKPVSCKSGRYGGTFVVKELVYAYAMWISPTFHLKVIRAFDQLQTNGVAVADHAAQDLLSNPLKYMELLLGQAKEIQAKAQRLEQENASLVKRIVDDAPKVDFAERVEASDTDYDWIEVI